LRAGTVDDTALAFPVHVASNRAQARAECEPGLLRFLRVATEAALPSVQGDPKSFEAFRQVRARMERVTYADMDRKMGVFGDPEYCIVRVRELQAEYGFDEFICYFNQGRLMDHALVKESMTLFAQEVMPHFRGGRRFCDARARRRPSSRRDFKTHRRSRRDSTHANDCR
jgi:alkanesulfonate monooxygenase SsuD/methylene tetrahydromethanopterin reductase-like flavin-dependent oxidoreductase (luciferase family)